MTHNPPEQSIPQSAPSQFPVPPPNYPGGSPPEAPKGPGFAIAGVVFGLVGTVVPLLPMNLDGIRHFVAFPCGLIGVTLAIVGLIGRRSGKPVAAIGVFLSGLALVLGIGTIASHLNHLLFS